MPAALKYSCQIEKGSYTDALRIKKYVFYVIFTRDFVEISVSRTLAISDNVPASIHLKLARLYLCQMI
jgi:hypothetical protein